MKRREFLKKAVGVAIASPLLVLAASKPPVITETIRAAPKHSMAELPQWEQDIIDYRGKAFLDDNVEPLPDWFVEKMADAWNNYHG